MGLQCKPCGKLKRVHVKLDNQVLKEKNEVKKALAKETKNTKEKQVD